MNQNQKLLDWLCAHNCEVDNVQKGTLNRASARDDIPPKARRAIELRLAGAHAAAGKFQTLLDWRDSDGRIRGAFKFHGASTGRWTSLGVQLHNLKRPLTPDMGAAIAAVAATGDHDHISRLYTDPLSVLGDVASASLRAAPGHRLIAADFSGIESRVLAWISDQQSKLDQWAKFDRTQNSEDEPYFIIGWAFGFSPEQARSHGKTGDLAFGYLGGEHAYKKFAPPDDRSTPAEIQQHKQTWRSMHPATVRFWDTLDRAAIQAVQQRGATVAANGDISFTCDDTFLRMRLPNGRQIAYPFPRLIKTDRGGLAVVYKDNVQDKWVDCRGGKAPTAQPGSKTRCRAWRGIFLRPPCRGLRPPGTAYVGSPKNTRSVRTLIETINEEPVIDGLIREHSRKPDKFYAWAEKYMPDARRADLFARQRRDGWDPWGDELDKFMSDGDGARDEQTDPALRDAGLDWWNR